ncbi:MAG: MFS transporter [Desulfobacteraceae bacterium]|nr:MFS transporter [Desulfobacteraceae bacterium]
MDLYNDQYFKRNAFGVALVEFFWGLGFPVIIESTFLQIFLKHLGAGDFLIGLVPAILMTGISLFPLFSSYLTRNHEYKRPMVLGLHIVSSFAVLAIGVFLFFARDQALILPVFFIAYILFSGCIGLTFPVWLNFLVKIFSPAKSVQGLAIMYIAQNSAKIISSLFIIKVVESYAFSLVSAAWIFFIAGLLFLIGSFCFLLNHELPAAGPQPSTGVSFFRHTWNGVADIVRNKNLLKYLIGDLDGYIVVAVISFYANYATQYFGIPNYTAAGLFVCFIYAGAILANITLGTLNLLSFKQKFLSTKICTLIVLIMLTAAPTLPGFLLASLLMGFCRGTRSIIYSPAVKQFSNRPDATSYFAIVPLLTLAFASGFPLFFGHMLERLNHLGAGAYQIMFGVCGLCMVVFLVIGSWVDFSPSKAIDT